MTSNELTYTLLSDGSSDQALMPIIEWTVSQLQPELLIQGSRADFSLLNDPPKDLLTRVEMAIKHYPCDILFIHRDSEKEPYGNRRDEVIATTEGVICKNTSLLTVAVIPVRMMEAWLLTDSDAIKIAAGNPNGRYTPELPALKSVEKLPNPKDILHNHLRQANGLKGRQLDKFNVGKAVHLVAQNMADFWSLKYLSAYLYFEEELRVALDEFTNAT